MNKKTGVLLINLGTPDSPSKRDVGKYLREFLNDPRVIDIPSVLRFLLVNLIIIPFRTPKSAKIYKKLWDRSGAISPLLKYGNIVKGNLQNEFGPESNVSIELAMRYGEPSLDHVLEKMRKEYYEQIIVLPLFPQYASASTGSALEKTLKIVRKWQSIPELKVISHFYDNEDYITTILERTKKYKLDEYDHILFSFHGLPIRQLEKANVTGSCENCNCTKEINENNHLCYLSHCYATSRILGKRLGLTADKYTVCFQSRLNSKWIEPFSDKIVIEQGEKGAKKLLMFSPAFVADCLETTIEISEEYQELFEEHGGEKIQLVESLNDHPIWIQGLKKMILSRI